MRYLTFTVYPYYSHGVKVPFRGSNAELSEYRDYIRELLSEGQSVEYAVKSVEGYIAARREMRRAARLKVHETQGRAKIRAVRDYLKLLIKDYEHKNRAAHLVPLIEHEPWEIFWPCFTLIWWWCAGDPKWNERLFGAMQRLGPHSSVRRLPETVKIFRGGSRSRLTTSLSWTTNLKLAIDFARLPNRRPHPCLAVTQIHRRDAFWFFTGWGENEIICRPTAWRLYPLPDSAKDYERLNAL
jgi:hypothetical protein